MNKGTVKFFNDSKGFGFIVEDDSNKEYFVHVSGLIDEIREGDAVEFELACGRGESKTVHRRAGRFCRTGGSLRVGAFDR